MSDTVVELSIAGAFEGSGVQFTATRLVIPENLAEQDWAELGRKLLRTDQVMQWWIGDWAAFGENKYGALKAFCELNGFHYQTTADRGWVSRSVHLSLRRENLQWSYYREIAPLKPKEQKRFLELAEKEQLPVAELRRKIRLAGGEQSALDSDGPIIRYAFKWCDDLLSWLRTRPMEFWNDDRRRIWKERLEPIVRFAQAL